MIKSSKRFLLSIELQERPVTGAEIMGFNHHEDLGRSGRANRFKVYLRK